jgi:hypothetical protein
MHGTRTRNTQQTEMKKGKNNEIKLKHTFHIGQKKKLLQ